MGILLMDNTDFSSVIGDAKLIMRAVEKRKPRTAGLYIHVPFCVRKCSYCDFYSIPCGDGHQGEFLRALKKELTQIPREWAPTTIYFGGGTPTTLQEQELEELCQLLRELVNLAQVEEWTCEVNPGTLTAAKARALRVAGVNRISLGVQSFDASNLQFLGRIHTGPAAIDTFRQLREQGFTNVGIDLIYGIPGASKHQLARDLKQTIALNPEHISCYCLSFEEHTPLQQALKRGEVREVADAEEAAQYRYICRTLQAAGYRHYEISNFARPGRECRHNLLYWSGGEFIGCGPSAHSHWKDKRYGNVRSLAAYCASFRDRTSPREFTEKLAPEAKARETLVMGLRQCAGISRKAFSAHTGFDYRALAGPRIDWLCKQHLLHESGDNLRLTQKGLFISDAIFAELI